jgi:hypothetical protein
VLPRLETPRRPRVKSLGPEAVSWLNGSGLLGRWQLLPHQEYIQHRRLEVGPDGRLQWETIQVTMARQQGKSVSLRCCAWWRIHQGGRFGEDQLVAQVANLARTAHEVWSPAAKYAQAVYGKRAAKWGKGAEEIDLTGHGHGRWAVQAADQNAGIGWSLTEAHIDEGWNVGRYVADDGLIPAMSEREQPQLYLWSTAGDAASDLMRHYRTVALQDQDGTGSVLLLEWSPPEELPWDHPNTWRWASPHWSDRRQQRLQARIDANIGETKFSLQYLNRWVRTANGLIPATVWAESHDTAAPPDRRPDVMAVEVSPEGDRYAWVTCWREGDHVVVRSSTSADLGRWRRAVAEADPRRVLYPPPVAIHEQPARRATTVGVTELNRHLLGVVRAVRAGQVRHHPADQVLTDDVLSMVAVTTESGLRLSQAKSTGPIDAARALIQAVGELLKPGTPKPKVRSSKARAA